MITQIRLVVFVGVKESDQTSVVMCLHHHTTDLVTAVCLSAFH